MIPNPGNNRRIEEMTLLGHAELAVLSKRSLLIRPQRKVLHRTSSALWTTPFRFAEALRKVRGPNAYDAKDGQLVMPQRTDSRRAACALALFGFTHYVQITASKENFAGISGDSEGTCRENR